MSDLHLNLKKKYFLEIQSGEKKQEFRLVNDYWKKRLIGKKYSRVFIKMGYPPRWDMTRQIVKPYRGYEEKIIYHPEFNGGNATKVFAIDVS